MKRIMVWKKQFLEAEREEASWAARVDMVVDFAENSQVHYYDSTPLNITFLGVPEGQRGRQREGGGA